MNEQISALKDDLAFMRTLAQEGRTPPLLGGAMLASAGVIFSLASLAQWAAMIRLINLSQSAVSAVWLGATVLFLICLTWLKRRQAMSGGRTPGSRAAGMAWQGVGWAIFVLLASVAIVCWRTGSTVPTLLLPSIILALYGAAWSVASAVSTLWWVRLTAIGSFVAALATAWVSTSPAVMLVYALALLLLAALPGAVLMRQAPSWAA
jgi:hypothetical protein